MPSAPVPTWGWAARHGLLLVALAPLGTQLIATVFNIWYNLTQIKPLLTASQYRLFYSVVAVFNSIAYTAALSYWFWTVASLRRPFFKAMRGAPLLPQRLLPAQRRLINLPWTASVIGGSGWAVAIPLLPLALRTSFEPLDPLVLVHLPISVLICGLIAITHSFFAVELASQWLLYPVLFQHAHPAEIPGAVPLSLRGRGILWAVSTVVSPIVSLLLLMAVPPPPGPHSPWFAMSVGALAIAFGLSTAWMLGKLVTAPVHALRSASQEVAAGNLDVAIDLPRADEFGTLIDEFNRMVAELREKQQLQETFGRHVGREAARQILQRDPGLGGVEQELTVMFADLRNFTSQCSHCTAQQVVGFLNRFLAEMVTIIEEGHGGMVNKFLGDGLMALFGAGSASSDHACRAVEAGRQMLARLAEINPELVRGGFGPLAMGIGIHTGRAMVGSIGSPSRLEYTAIGDTVNVASRVESLTKVVGEPLLMTAATRRALPETVCVVEMPPQQVKGIAEAVTVYALRA